jgi:acyl-CoA thioesterase FadM
MNLPSLDDHRPGRTAGTREHQRAAAAALGHELRALVDTAMRTEVPPDVLHRAADAVRLRYHRPVVLDVPLRVHAHVTGAEGRTVSVAGSITTDEDPVTALVTAEGVFVSPEPDRARALFPGMRENG